MKTKNKYAVLALATLVATSVALAQDNGGQGSMPPQGGMPPPREGRPGMMGQIRQEFREDRGEARTQFKEDMKARRDWMHGSTTPGMATPTPWKNYRENMKDIREDFRGKMASLTEAQVASITAKLGITPAELKAQLASGTPLRQIIGNKISPEDMGKILPPPPMRMGSGTMATDTRMMFRERPRGFFNSIRASIFGENPEGMGDNGEFNQGPNEGEPKPGIGNFFKRLFNF